MSHEFVIKRNGVLETYTRYEDIPLEFEHLIKFHMDIPPEPHTDEQHEEIEKLNDMFQELMRRERNNASRN